MTQPHYLLKGTFLLTLAGLLTRTAGFFYKIFLSRTIGAKEIGLFQLTQPVYAFCMALAGGGVQTAISRFTAEYCAKKEPHLAYRILFGSLVLSEFAAVSCAVLLYRNAAWIAGRFLLEPECAVLLRILAFSLPLCILHSCLSGFFIGQKKIAPSAISQMAEQLLRVTSAFFFYAALRKNGREMDASVMALGQLAGEAAAAMYCIFYLMSAGGTPTKAKKRLSLNGIFHTMKKIMPVSVPLGVNRMLLCVLQGIEAAMLPQRLQISGLTSHSALSSYGTLTGMALPLLLFPTAITGSLGTLLLPAVSEARTLKQEAKIRLTVTSSFRGSTLLGCFFLTAFLLFGEDVGTLLFDSRLAGIYIRRLALICPWLYLNTAMSSILHGLGKTTAVFVWNMIGFSIRFGAILYLVPQIGINGYLCGMILSQLFISVCTLFLLLHEQSLSVYVIGLLAKSSLVCIICVGTAVFLRRFLPFIRATTRTGLLLSLFFYSISFLVLSFFLALEQNERRQLRGRLAQKFRN